MQFEQPMNTKAKTVRRTKRAKMLAVIGAGAILIFAAVRGTTAQNAPADSHSPATQPAMAGSRGSADLISEGPIDGHLRLTINRSSVVTTKVPYKRVSVGNPDIADVNPIGPQNILVTAKKPGNTQLIVWDDGDRSQVVDVNVAFDVQSLEGELKQMFPNANIQVSQLNGSIALKGTVPSTEVAEQAVAVASPYANKVMNFMTVSGGKQVMLQVRFAEVSRTAVSQLGINGNYVSGGFLGGSNIGQVNPSNRMLDSGLVGQTPPFNGVNLNGATAVNPSVTLYGAGQIGNFYLEYFIQALRSNNLMRVLAEPNLIATSGQEASFLAGGEFPVPVTQGGGGAGGVAVTVEYREFGVRLKFVPVVLGNGKIRLLVAPEVSDLDFTTAVRFNGFVIPGLTSRKVQTTIELGDGQSFAIAGLLNNSVTAQKDVTPLLGDLPVVGALFRSVRYQRKETELVVLVTPRLVDAMNPAQTPTLPGEHWRNPNEMELFWNRDLGGEVEPKKTHRSGATTRPVSTSADAMANDDGSSMPMNNGQPMSNDPSQMGQQTPMANDEADAPRFRGEYGFSSAGNSNGNGTSSGTHADGQGTANAPANDASSNDNSGSSSEGSASTSDGGGGH